MQIEIPTSPWKPAAERQRDRDAKRDAVLRTAARLFVENGFHRTKMADVAEHLHITKPALYHYFRNKEDILYACYMLGSEMIESLLAEVELNNSTGLDRAVAFLKAYTLNMTTDFGMCLVTVDDRDLAPDSRRKVRTWKRSIDSRLRSCIAEGISDGSVRPVDPRIAAFLLAGSVNWVGQWFRESGPSSAKDIADAMADMARQALTARG
ncbi:TetR family transcriptional regulator [Tistrella bauzanensis]|uniref:TetR family transcriptional regulator n=1 Tax=Tistrella bauzanensis TaxID=657419 RepID=A0ABQ1J274_9PROT|nr:TetR/AcrR family transcriptional regulator [Tistrella bauzanensis]GGB58233.1 TetR family transcriptional regulator [Tistrella bauzanensis]